MKISILLICVFISVSFSSICQEITADSFNKEKKKIFYTSSVKFARNLSGRVVNRNEGIDDTYDNVLALQLDFLANYDLIRDYLSVGLGLYGSRVYKPNFNQIGFLGELRGYLSNEVNTIFLFIQMGQSIPIGRSVYRGLDLSFGAGYRFAIQNHILMVHISAGGKRSSYNNDFYRYSDNYVMATGVYFGLGYQF